MMNNAVFGKTMQTERRGSYVVSEPNYHSTQFYTENLLAIKMKKIVILINEQAYLGLSILALSKLLMYEFWYDHVKPKYCEKEKLCYRDTESITVYVKTGDIYKDIAECVETKFDTSKHELDRPLPKGTKKGNWINER